MRSNTTSITCIILTKNEEQFIETCLKSCDIFDEILIIDSGSTDKTLEIAQKFTSNIHVHPFTNFLEQRQYGATLATSEWIFFLDADETLSPQLKDALLRGKIQSKYDAFSFPRKNYLLGHWIAHCGWYPDYQIRLVRKSTLYFTDRIIHEGMRSTGPLHTVPIEENAHIEHQTCTDFSKFITKLNHYTTLEAIQHKDNPAFKLTRWGIFTRSFGMFTQTLFHFKGIKDGLPGFIVACYNMIYSMVLMIKLWELRQRHDR